MEGKFWYELSTSFEENKYESVIGLLVLLLGVASGVNNGLEKVDVDEASFGVLVMLDEMVFEEDDEVVFELWEKDNSCFCSITCCCSYWRNLWLWDILLEPLLECGVFGVIGLMCLLGSTDDDDELYFPDLAGVFGIIKPFSCIILESSVSIWTLFVECGVDKFLFKEADELPIIEDVEEDVDDVERLLECFGVLGSNSWTCSVGETGNMIKMYAVAFYFYLFWNNFYKL